MEEEKAKELSLFLAVIHPASMPELFGDTDIDGYMYGFRMLELAEPSLVTVCIRQGISPNAAIEMLNSLITKIIQHGDRLLNLEEGQRGLFTSDNELDFRDIG